MKLGIGIGLALGVAATVPPFTPADDASITFWLKPGSGVVLSGSNVTTWTDSKAGAVWTGGTNKPTFNAANASFKGLPTLHWSSAANQNLTSTQALNQPASYFMVVKCDDQTAVRSLITLSHIIQAQVDSQQGIIVNAGASSNYGHALLTGGVHTVAVIVSGSTTKVYVDGALQALTSGTGNPGAQNQTAVQIGFTAVSWVGDMADVVMWNNKAISAGDVANMHGWAVDRYGAAA